MITPETMIGAVIIAVIGSSGVWSIVLWIIQRKANDDDSLHRGVKGLLHNAIFSQCEEYINRGYITSDEYENFNNYLYEPYKDLKGNGTAEKIKKEVDKLPIREIGGK